MHCSVRPLSQRAREDRTVSVLDHDGRTLFPLVSLSPAPLVSSTNVVNVVVGACQPPE